MERRPTSIRTILAVSVIVLTLIAPWALGQDPEAITELRRQAEQGDAEAQIDLGLRYANGEGVPQDDAEAVRWFRLAAEQENADAQDLRGGVSSRTRPKRSGASSRMPCSCRGLGGVAAIRDGQALSHGWFRSAGAPCP